MHNKQIIKHKNNNTKNYSNFLMLILLTHVSVNAIKLVPPNLNGSPQIIYLVSTFSWSKLQGPDNIFPTLWKKYFKVVTSAKNFLDCKYVVEEWKSTTNVIISFSLALIILVFCDFCENLRDTIFRTWQEILFY